MSLSREQIQFFRQCGFISLPVVLPEATVATVKEAIWRDIRAEVEPVVRDREGRIVRISNIWKRDPIFRDLLTGSQVLDPLESLLGPNIELVLNRHNHATLRL